MRAMPYSHILQTWEWGEFKHATVNWKPFRWAFKRNEELVAMASVGQRRVGALNVLYAPKGPVLAYDDIQLAQEIIGWLEKWARRKRAIWVKIDPDVPLATGVPGEEDDTPSTLGQTFKDLIVKRRWQFSKEQVQFRNTIVIDLNQSEEDLFASMSQNTRRKVRQAEKKGVTIRTAGIDDLPILYDLYANTGERDDFIIRPYNYYATLWRDFMEAGLAHAFIAEYEHKPIAHVILFHFGSKCWYFYGASSNEERQRMPNYALQWKAIQWAKAQGYAAYDMWGAPDEFDESDGMWGVYEFKRGFRGTVVRHIGAWDYSPFRPLYALYNRTRSR
ncbi:peptidoglycan bridge formation glycyltransferase FemA/FemB family protein [Phototrophicus methaneseepsis]|uniref:Peptidoglycan bridge formation glycyltransferase FemA/FemB family protein n=1 Tax=Phototrophicus methaneseepsis TaxID=2710758 RepID=A0A7S8E7R4_9CHLR|nr:peptidoglycan bridge formation glycyltransferase FemA/FemB family protein [Phototrophicus methaneseepsis]